MNNVRLSINVLKIKGAVVTTMPNANGRPEYYVSIPASQLFVPANANGQAFLTATLIATPDNQFSDFAIRPYVAPQDFAAMNPEQRKAIPFIGSGRFMTQPLATSLTSGATTTTMAAAATLPPSPTSPAPASAPQGSGSAACPPMAPPSPQASPNPLAGPMAGNPDYAAFLAWQESQGLNPNPSTDAPF